MKKKVILAMCIAAALALAGCGNKNEAAKTDDGQEEAEATVSYEPVLYEDLSSKLISLGQYKGLEVSRDTAEVTDEDVYSYRIEAYMETEEERYMIDYTEHTTEKEVHFEEYLKQTISKK